MAWGAYRWGDSGHEQVLLKAKQNFSFIRRTKRAHAGTSVIEEAHVVIKLTRSRRARSAQHGRRLHLRPGVASGRTVAIRASIGIFAVAVVTSQDPFAGWRADPHQAHHHKAGERRPLINFGKAEAIEVETPSSFDWMALCSGMPRS